MNAAKRNPPLVYTFGFFYMFIIILPIVVPFFQSVGLTMEQVYISQVAFALAIGLFEVPSAYIGDMWGRKNAIILGTFLTGCGFSLLYYADNYFMILAYEALLGVGAAFVSGADLSILYDSIDSDELIKTNSLASLTGTKLIGEAFAAILCGLIVVYGYKSVVILQVIVGWIPFMISLFLIEPTIEKMNKSHTDNFKEVLSFIFKEDSFLRLIFFNVVTWSLATFFSVWIIQKYWYDSEVGLSNMSYLWSAGHIIAAIAGKLTPKIKSLLGIKKLLIMMALMSPIGYFTMGSLSVAVGIYAAFLFYMARGIHSVSMRVEFNRLIPSKFRNTANSLTSLFFRVGFLICGPGIGYMIDHYGLHTTLNTLGGFFSFLFIILLIPMVKKLKSNQLG